MLEYTHSGFNIYIGQNKEENHWLIMNMNLEDYWLHISDYSSAHAIIKNPLNIKIPIKFLKYVCCIMKANSNKCKSMKKLSFDISRGNQVSIFRNVIRFASPAGPPWRRLTAIPYQ